MNKVFITTVLAGSLFLAGCANTGVEQRENLLNLVRNGQEQLVYLDNLQERFEGALEAGESFIDLLPSDLRQRVTAALLEPVEAASVYVSRLEAEKDRIRTSVGVLEAELEAFDAEGVDSWVVGTHAALVGAKEVSTFLPPGVSNIVNLAATAGIAILGIFANNQRRRASTIVKAIEKGKVSEDDELFIVDKATVAKVMDKADRQFVKKVVDA